VADGIVIVVVVMLIERHCCRALNVDVVGDVCRNEVRIFHVRLALLVPLHNGVADSLQLFTKPANRQTDIARNLSSTGLDLAGGRPGAQPNCGSLDGKQEIVSGSGICWAICKSAPHPRQPRQHSTTQFLQAECPS